MHNVTKSVTLSNQSSRFKGYERIFYMPKNSKCPCCTYLTLSNKTWGSYEICPVCFWQNDLLCIEDPSYCSPLNEGTTLSQAKTNHIRFGAFKEDIVHLTRLPLEEELSQVHRKNQQYDAFFKHILDAFPSYQKRYKTYCLENYGPGENKLAYIDLIDLADHVYQLFCEGRHEELKRGLPIFEYLILAENDNFKNLLNEDTSNLIATGLLESLENKLKTTQYTEFESLLGPICLKFWSGISN